MRGTANKTLTGRSEQISFGDGVASTYACYNPCPPVINDVWINPGGVETEVGATTWFTATQTEINSYGQEFGPYPSESVAWDSFDTNVATINFDGNSEAVGAGLTNIQGTVERTIWFDWGGGYCEPVVDYIYRQAPVEVAPKVTITKADGSTLPTPFRIGINGGGNDRKQSLKATVSPPNQAANITIEVSGKITLTNVVQAGNGVITFDVVGKTKSDATGDATITAKRSSSTLDTKTVSVVVPSKVSNQSVGSYWVQNLATDGNSSPATWGLSAGYVFLATWHCKTVTVTVHDQFDASIGDVYINAHITEDTQGPLQYQPINQSINSSSSYLDPVCRFLPSSTVIDPIIRVEGNGAVISAWLADAHEPLDSFSQNVNPPVKVDGFLLNPGLGTRRLQTAPPSSVNITFP